MADDTPPADFDERGGPTESQVRTAHRVQEILAPMPVSSGQLTTVGFGGVIMAQKTDTPRDLQKIEKEIQKVCTLYGDQFYYSWEVKSRDGKTGKTVTSEISGVTIDGASVLRQLWRNCTVRTIVVRDDGEFIYLASQFCDYEAGSSVERPFKQRTGMKFGKMQKDRVMETTFSIGVSKSERNVILDALRIQREQMLRYAKANLRDKIGKDIPKAKARLMQIAGEVNVPLLKMEQYVERKEKDWVASHIFRLVQAIRAIQEGDATVEDVFGQEVAEGDLGGEDKPAVEGQGGKVEEKQPATDKKAEPEKKAPAAKKEPEPKKDPPKDPPPAQQQSALPTAAEMAAGADNIRANPEDRRPADEDAEPEEEQGAFGYLTGGDDADLGGD